MYQKCVKRLLDIILSFLGILFCLLPMAVIALVIKLDSPGPVLCKQKRVGRGEKGRNFFYMYKFRTMRQDTPEMPTQSLENPSVYMTGVGSFLRRTSLDELPQLFHILSGKMSVVGPRPVLWNEFELLEKRERYHVESVRPGLTGWAQINGRDEISSEEKARLDGEYVEKISFWFDLKCFVKTFGVVLRQEGIGEGKREAEAVETSEETEKDGTAVR